jgi:hypothetical protein
LTRFTISVAPTYENGFVAGTARVTVDIFSEDALPHSGWEMKLLPDKIKSAIESAMAEAVSKDPPADRRQDQILERLDKIEKRLKQIESNKSGK